MSKTRRSGLLKTKKFRTQLRTTFLAPAPLMSAWHLLGGTIVQCVDDGRLACELSDLAYIVGRVHTSFLHMHSGVLLLDGKSRYQYRPPARVRNKTLPATHSCLELKAPMTLHCQHLSVQIIPFPARMSQCDKRKLKMKRG